MTGTKQLPGLFIRLGHLLWSIRRRACTNPPNSTQKNFFREQLPGSGSPSPRPRRSQRPVCPVRPARSILTRSNQSALVRIQETGFLCQQSLIHPPQIYQPTTQKTRILAPAPTCWTHMPDQHISTSPCPLLLKALYRLATLAGSLLRFRNCHRSPLQFSQPAIFTSRLLLFARESLGVRDVDHLLSN